MQWTLAATLAAALAGAGVSAPAARAGGGCVRVEIRRAAWRPAHYEDRVECFVIREGYWREESIPATFVLRFDLGSRRFVRVEVRPATVVLTWVPPARGERVVRVLVPGRWVPART